ncbi:hypothetical protein SM14VA7_26410 [Serratia marcescens]|nr:hypothetical protein SM14VA7_26410 [Serratia marcescens]
MSINLNNAPLWITAKALEKLKQFRAGRLDMLKLKDSRKKSCLSSLFYYG